MDVRTSDDPPYSMSSTKLTPFAQFQQTAVAFGKFVWNRKEKKVLGRDGESWGYIGLFYLVFYSILASFFVGIMSVFYQTLDAERPRLTGQSSLLKDNPGMGFRPMADSDTTLIRFTNHQTSYTPYVDSIKHFLKPYTELSSTSTVNCSEVAPSSDQACRVDLQALTSECNEANEFGYKDKQPCVLLRLNKIFDWMPKEYTPENVNHSHIPQELINRILADPKIVYVHCIGENPGDVDNIGALKYYPEQGFRHHFYPFTNQKDYRSPLVFVKFLNPTRHVALMVECRALAPNIYYDKTERQGGVNFELLVDP